MDDPMGGNFQQSLGHGILQGYSRGTEAVPTSAESSVRRTAPSRALASRRTDESAYPTMTVPMPAPAARLPAERGRLHDHAHSHRLTRCGGKPAVSKTRHEIAGKRRARRALCARAHACGAWRAAPSQRSEHRAHALHAVSTQSTGHAAAAHTPASDVAPHGSPPSAARTATARVRTAEPSPQETEQLPQLHRRMQCAGGGRAQRSAGRSLCRCRNARNAAVCWLAVPLQCRAFSCLALLCVAALSFASAVLDRLAA
jgi:hypothetical protein